jgi:hypothetical protein
LRDLLSVRLVVGSNRGAGAYAVRGRQGHLPFGEESRTEAILLEGDDMIFKYIVCVISLLYSTSCMGTAVSQNNVSANNMDTSSQVGGHPLQKILTLESSGIYLNYSRFIFQDLKGDYWVGSGPDANKYNEKQNQWSKFPNQVLKMPAPMPMTAISQSVDGSIWIVALPALGPNLSKFNGEKWELINKFSSIPVTSMF